MPAKAHVDELLSAWEEAGRKPTPEDLCRDCPELLEELRRQIALRSRVDSLLVEDAPNADAGEEGGPAATATLPPAAEALTLIDNYQILGLLGEGGFSVVYMAQQLRPVQRRVALKVLKPGMDSRQVLARFEAERQALAMMDHPNLARVYDAGTTPQGRPYFVMEHVAGEPITAYCDRHRLTTEERLGLFADVCQAVQHAHQKGIIHRDIKPSNILVTAKDDKPVVKVIDFGVAKATSQRLTESTVFTEQGQLIGTPQYMSPEQAEMGALDIDTRSDIYSLGVVLYELLTGVTPFDAKTLRQAAIGEMQRIIREVEPARPSTRLVTLTPDEGTALADRQRTEIRSLRRRLQQDLDWIVLKALDKDRTRRYATASGLANDVQRYLRNEPVLAGPPTTGYRIRKFVRRHRAGVAVAVSVLILAMAGGAAYIRAVRGEQRRSEAARLLAERERNRAADAEQRALAESINARRAAARSEARYLIQQGLLPEAIVRATEACQLGGKWEDGALFHEIAASSRRHWQLTGRVRLREPPSRSCFVVTRGGLRALVVCVDGELRSLDARTGATLGSVRLESAPTELLALPDVDSVGVVFKNALAVHQLPTLNLALSRPVPEGVIFAAARGRHLVLGQGDGVNRLLSLPKLDPVESFRWADIGPARELQLRPASQACISPSGTLVLFGGSPALVWDRRQSPARFWTTNIFMGNYQFADDTRVVSWIIYDAVGNFTTLVNVYDLAGEPKLAATRYIPGEDLQGSLQFTTSVNAAEGAPVVALGGRAGASIASIHGIHDDILSDRYANVMPTIAPPPVLLAVWRGEGGWFDVMLALGCGSEVLLFGGFHERGMSNSCATVCQDGMLYAYSPNNFNPYGMELVLDPFAAGGTRRTFSIQWLADSQWFPWAVAATPDAATVAVIAQETNIGGRAGPMYGRSRALIYRPAALTPASGGWEIERVLELESAWVPPTGPRFAVVEPSERVLIYWNGTPVCHRMDVRTGQSLGTVDLGVCAARSPDGQRVAGIAGERLRVYDVASGNVLLDVPAEKAKALCFSADGRRVAASGGDRLVIHDIDSGRCVASFATRLLPLALPCQGDRFVAFQADPVGESGAVVLADMAEGRTVAVLTRASRAFTLAFFSPSGREIALGLNLWTPSIIRSMEPRELATLLGTPIALPSWIKPPAPVDGAPAGPVPASLRSTATRPSSNALPAADAGAIRSQVGKRVTVVGRIARGRLSDGKDSLSLVLTEPIEQPLLIWASPRACAGIVARLGGDPVGVLRGRTVQATGKLTPWQGALELVLDDAEDLRWVDPSAAPQP